MRRCLKPDNLNALVEECLKISLYVRLTLQLEAMLGFKAAAGSKQKISTEQGRIRELVFLYLENFKFTRKPGVREKTACLENPSPAVESSRILRILN